MSGIHRSVTILGAGLVGSLLAVVLRKMGYPVTILERRPDMRTAGGSAGRSINLAMSARGWKALGLAGIQEQLAPLAIAMQGRSLHQPDGTMAFQPYGKNGEAIYSVSRGQLNAQLMTAAEEQGAEIRFGSRVARVHPATNELTLIDDQGGESTYHADLLIGADGAFSALRSSYTHTDRVSSSQRYIEHGYKELHIPPADGGGWRLEKNSLHIWPRRNFMLIGLPNTDGSFTGTLFLPFEGEPSFASLRTEEAVRAFFDTYFPDAPGLMPQLMEDFRDNPVSSLVTTHIGSWHYRDKSFLIGDAAHAIVPFYGQGMNAGFEDVTVLAGLIGEYAHDWAKILPAYQDRRKPNGDAVAELALLNFVEMRDKVADPQFLQRKQIEKELGKIYPERFNSVYEMVSFSHTPYALALHCIQAQDRLLARIMAEGDGVLEARPQLDRWMKEYEEEIGTQTS